MVSKEQRKFEKKPKKGGIAEFLYNDRFNCFKKIKRKTNKISVLEFSGLSSLKERIELKNYNFCSNNDYILNILNSFDYSLSIPPRIPYSKEIKEFYSEIEAAAFTHWKSQKTNDVYERNLETWRQFWITCERSETIAQVIDSRNAELFYNPDIVKLYPNKKHLLLFNKCDLVTNCSSLNTMSTYNGIPCYYYSSKENLFSYEFSGTVGFIGYPNVGKSSTINLIASKYGRNRKTVKVSATPGMTKHLQNIDFPAFQILDCPGLVFPMHSKLDLILMNVINVEQVNDLMKYEDFIVEKIGVDVLRKDYKLNEHCSSSRDILYEISKKRRLDRSVCLKDLVIFYTLNKTN